ncbi:MAG: serine dehydratase [Firmicutes bacterium]|nr:serine dehydratase [Bacillota bacterium]
MQELRQRISAMQPLTIGEIVALANEFKARVVDVVLLESEIQTGLTRAEILTSVMKEYDHNIRALEIGLEDGESILLGTVASQLNTIEGPKCFADKMLDDALLFTLAAQVGNHCIGLRPCAGTGDSCPYAGFIKAMQVNGYDDQTVAEIAALILKIGSIFRVGKVTTGCNMEGFGAGTACIAAATAVLEGGSPEQMEKAMVLAMSPTIGVPCTPRVLVPALCTTHVGGAILMGMYAGKLCTKVEMMVNVPFDVMIAMASQVHVESGKHLVPTVVEYMEPFFKRKASVESLVSEDVKDEEARQMEQTLAKANRLAKEMARETKSILNTYGEAVVGGSSQAVGSPTNAARIANKLINGTIKKVTIELYPELFKRRSINVPGILMGAVFGASTSDYEMYNQAIDKVKELGIAVEIIEGSAHAIQKITIETDEMTASVDTLNRGGGRLVLREAVPSTEAARKIADELGIQLVE